MVSIQSCPILDDTMEQLSLQFPILYNNFQLFYALADIGFDGVYPPWFFGGFASFYHWSFQSLLPFPMRLSI